MLMKVDRLLCAEVLAIILLSNYAVGIVPG